MCGSQIPADLVEKQGSKSGATFSARVPGMENWNMTIFRVIKSMYWGLVEKSTSFRITEPMGDAPKAILPYFSTGFGGLSHKNPPKVHRAESKNHTPCDPIKHSTPCVN